MLIQVIIAWVLMALCVVIHAAGLTVAWRWLSARFPSPGAPLYRSAWPLIRLAAWAILLHLVQVVAWATVYVAVGAMPDLAAALYFSAVTYTTTGYGDLVLPPAWRLVGAVEALTGILMCGLSTGFFFAVLSRGFSQSTSTNRD